MFLDKRFDLDRTVRLVINCVLFAGIVYLINVLRGVLLPFLVGCLIAYLLEPWVQFNRRLLSLRGRVVATFVTLFEITLILGLVLYFTIPMIISESAQMAEMIQNYASTELGSDRFVLPQQIHQFIRSNIDLDDLATKFSSDEWNRMLERTLTVSWGLLTGSISFLMSVVSWAVVFLYIIFIMIDYDNIAASLRGLVVPRYRHLMVKISTDVKRSMNHYFRGQALVALCVGILFAIGFLIIGLPLAIVLGLFIGLLNMVPYLQLISLIPVTLIVIFSSVSGTDTFWTLMGETIAVYCIVQVIQDFYLTPRIIGKAMSMNPAFIFLSLSVWGTLLGMIGLIIAIPLTTLLAAYYEEFVIQRSVRRHRQSLDNQAKE